MLDDSERQLSEQIQFVRSGSSCEDGSACLRPYVFKNRDVDVRNNGTALSLHNPPRETGQRDAKLRVADWFSEWWKPIRRFIARRNAIPSRDLDDVAQEVFLRLMRYDRAQLIENPQAYLFKIAANVATEWAIRSRNTSARELAWLKDSGTGTWTDGDTGRLEAEEEIAEALLCLRPRQREVMKMQFFEGLSHAQTARRLGVTERVVKRTLAKSYQRLRRQLARS